MRIQIKAEIFWLWRLLDSEEEEIEILFQRRRDAKSAIRFLIKTLKRKGWPPQMIVADKLKSYKRDERMLLKRTEHHYHKQLIT